MIWFLPLHLVELILELLLEIINIRMLDYKPIHSNKNVSTFRAKASASLPTCSDLRSNILEVAAKQLQGSLIFKLTLHVPRLNYVL
jgi:hypothetical protein